MVSVQAAGCAPIVAAYEDGKDASEFSQNAATVASGLRVPKALGDFIVLRAMRETRGTAVASTNDVMLVMGRELAALEGIFAAPEGAATVVAAQKLAEKEWIRPEETVVAFNTGSGYKYTEAWEQALRMKRRPSGRQGGQCP